MTDTPEADDAKPRLKPANENPWYCLMTLHGEQPEGASGFNHDLQLHARNRRDWNKWQARWLNDAARETLLRMEDIYGKPRFSKDELTPHNDAERSAVEAAFVHRAIASGFKNMPDLVARIDLSETQFERHFCAINLLFRDLVDISGATFWKDADIKGATFARFADLSRAKFSGIADLSGTLFFGYADLSGATFASSADLSGATFSKIHLTNFSRATFKREANFLNASMEGDTRFENARFLRYPPKFHGATLNEGVTFHGVEWPDAPINHYDAQEHVYNYQRLKQIMENLKKHEDEFEFFAREMQAKRIVDGGWTTPRGIINSLYGATSDYGRSILRPALGLAITLAVTTLPIAAWMSGPRWLMLPKLKNALSLSFANVLAPLNVRKDFYDAKILSDLPNWLKMLSGVQTVSGLLFAFLIGLALRNRFRLK